MRLADTHAHLDDRRYDQDRQAVIARCAAEGIGIVTIGADLPSSEEAVRIAARYRQVWAAVGVHPHDAKSFPEDGIERLEALAKEKNVVAIGEIGLDYYRNLSPRADQLRVFRAQLRLAVRLSLPVVLHHRESTDDTLAVLSEHAPLRGVVHAFQGDELLAGRFLDLGLHLGIGGPVTYPANDTLRRAVASAPLDRLVLETDCPYLTPIPHRGKRNEPAYVALVAEEIARVRGVPVEDVSAQTTSSARALFRLEGGPGTGSHDTSSSHVR